ncbi:MAG: VOC family protein [Thermomicrobiales bacterium]
MSKVSVYLNFTDSTEAAFSFYKTVFGTEYLGEPSRYGDMPTEEGSPEPSEDFKRLILNVQLPIMDGTLLMGSDAPTEMGFGLKMGNNVQICLHPDSREEADRLYAALAEGGEARMPLQDQFWGDYYGELADKFGVVWLVAHTPSA